MQGRYGERKVISIGKWVSGADITREKADITREKKVTPLDLFTLVVETGLQPHDKRGKAIPPPDVKKCQEQIDTGGKKAQGSIGPDAHVWSH